jgi:hypothetical protein
MFIQSFHGVKEKNKDKSILEVIDMIFDHYRYSRKAKNQPYIRPKGPGTGTKVVIPGRSEGKTLSKSMEEKKHE